MKDMKEVMDKFSELTQQTLSLFHLTGTDSEIDSEMEEIIRILQNKRNKKIISAISNKDGSFTRIFEDGSTDECKFEDIKKEVCFKVGEENQEIINILNKEGTPLALIRNSKIKLVENKKIESAVERMFFMGEDI